MLLILATLGAIGAALFGRRPGWLAYAPRGTPASASGSNAGAGLPASALAAPPRANPKEAAQ